MLALKYQIQKFGSLCVNFIVILKHLDTKVRLGEVEMDSIVILLEWILIALIAGDNIRL